MSFKKKLKCSMGKHEWIKREVEFCKSCGIPKLEGKQRYLFLLKLGITNFFLTLGFFTLFTFFLIANGYEIKSMTCFTESMKPILDCRDIVLYKRLDKFEIFSHKYVNGEGLGAERNYSYIENEIEVGDIIIFYYDGLVVHRVIGKCEDGFITKGDNNWVSDGCIPYERIIGKVVWYLKLP